MTYTLRPYQEEVVNRMVADRHKPGNSLVVVAQGLGKSVIIAELANRLNEEVLILVPTRELLLQNLEKLEAFVDQKDIGVYSAGVNRKERGKYTIATIQSAYRHPEVFKGIKVVLFDESSGLSPDKEGMYYQPFNAIGVQKVYGLTASPWRQTIVYNRPGGWAGYTGAKWQRIRQLEAITTTKMITRFRPYKGKWFWSRVLAIINVDKATKMGYLTPLKYIDDSLVVHEQLKLNKSRSDFDLDYFEQLCNNYTKLVDYINKIKQKKILVFCSSIEQATKLAELGHYFVVTADTKAKERKQIIEQFRIVKRGVLCGVNVFSYGFDVPDLEAIVLLRPTRSLALHSQVLGRLTRLTDGKEFGYVYDLVGNIRSMGRLETIKTTYIDGKLNVVSETKPQGWHLVPLFTWNINQKQKDKNELS